MGKRLHLCEYETDEPEDALSLLFGRMIEIPTIKAGKSQSIETLINEALLFAKYSRSERETWNPRIPKLSEMITLELDSRREEHRNQGKTTKGLKAESKYFSKLLFL